MTTPAQEFATVSVTCETPGCKVQGVTYTGLSVQVHSVEPKYRVVCGQCGNSPALVLS